MFTLSDFKSKQILFVDIDVVEINQSPKVLRMIQEEILTTFSKQFSMADSVLIFPISSRRYKDIWRFGHSVQEEEGVILMS